MGAGTFNQPQQGYGQPPNAPAQVRGTSGLAVAGLILGIIALLTIWMWGALMFAPLAVLAGLVGANEALEQEKRGAPAGVAGAVLGAVAIVLTIIIASL